jgi:Nickel responsive protein SCO4226-like
MHPSGSHLNKENKMALYMDTHRHIEGLTADAAAHAHEADLKTQGKYGVKYLRYWVDENDGKVFCLIEAPNKEAAIAVHRESHGLVADEIVEVKEG